MNTLRMYYWRNRRITSLVLHYEEWEPHILERVRLRDIKHNQCHWPYGDPFEGSFAFCGLPTIRHSHYCEGHLTRAYQAQTPRLLQQHYYGMKFRRAV